MFIVLMKGAKGSSPTFVRRLSDRQEFGSETQNLQDAQVFKCTLTRTPDTASGPSRVLITTEPPIPSQLCVGDWTPNPVDLYLR